MIKELYQEDLQEISLNVTNSEIDSIRKKNIVKSGCRIYHNGYIGIAGTLGQPNAETWAQAEENLSNQIPYQYAAECGKKEQHILGKEMTSEEFLAQMEAMLASLRKEFPQFIFSNKINLVNNTVCLQNDQGLHYLHRDIQTLVSIVVREEDSVNIFDTALVGCYRNFDSDQFLVNAREQLQAHMNLVELPKDEIMPIIAGWELLDKSMAYVLHGQRLHKNASLLSGKVGEKLFSDHFTLQVDRSREAVLTPFFDTEGSVLYGDCTPLIEQGVLLRGYTDKKNADEFSVENTASAGGVYDQVPVLDSSILSVKPTGQTLQEIVGNRQAIFINMASGGDTTPDGMFATPVQCAYLYQDGKLIGRLPEFSIKGSMFDLLGKDYLGCSTDQPYENSQQLVMQMQVSR